MRVSGEAAELLLPFFFDWCSFFGSQDANKHKTHNLTCSPTIFSARGKTITHSRGEREKNVTKKKSSRGRNSTSATLHDKPTNKTRAVLEESASGYNSAQGAKQTTKVGVERGFVLTSPLFFGESLPTRITTHNFCISETNILNRSPRRNDAPTNVSVSRCLAGSWRAS